jgi:hypothetical protein
VPAALSVPPGQKYPTGHGAGAATPSGATTGHTPPGAHGRHVVAPGLSWYVPLRHGRGAASPPGQKLPRVQLSVATASPPGQYRPGVHGYAVKLVVMPENGHVKPAGQGVQCATETPPVALAGVRVPGGQGVPAALPPAQKCPAGHDALAGVGVASPPAHTNPGAHAPEGAVSPVALQYEPGVHSAHSDVAARPLLAEKRPAGHGTSRPVDDPPAHA